MVTDKGVIMSSAHVWAIVVVVVVVFIYIRSRGASVADLSKALKNGAVVVDVRTASEFDGGHYEGAKNIPLDQIQSRLDEIGSRAAPVILHCHSGMRSASAQRILRAAGFTNVLNAGTLRRVEKAAGDDK
jgi:phage shock protein E